MRERILIVDDDYNIADLVSIYLKKEQFEISIAYDGKSALREFSSHTPDLVVLDIMLPQIDGYTVCKEIRRISQVPIIMLTAKGETFDKIIGLELGADDYIVKPFDPKELVARIKAVLRRISPQNHAKDEIAYPGLLINKSNYSVTYMGQMHEIPPKELELLYFLAVHPNQVFTREQLLENIWGYDFYGDSRTVDVHIKRLREKFADDLQRWEIKTVWGVGYKFEVRV